MQPPAVNESASSSQSQSRSAGWLHRLVLSLLLGAAAVVRFHCLACKNFWFDECFSIEIARVDWRNFLHLMWWREANMSLYYLMLRAWLHLGQSPPFIRSLSVLVSAATLPAIYWVGKLLYERRVALIATALLAFNAYSVRYAQEARSYALFTLLATLSSGFLISWLRQTRADLRSQSATSRFESLRRWGYIIASILAVYTHFYALLLLAVHWIALARVDHRHKPASILMRWTWGIIGTALFPLLVFVAKTGAGPIRWIQRPGLGDLFEFFEHLSGGDNWILPVVFAAACAAG